MEELQAFVTKSFADTNDDITPTTGKHKDKPFSLTKYDNSAWLNVLSESNSSSTGGSRKSKTCSVRSRLSSALDRLERFEAMRNSLQGAKTASVLSFSEIEPLALTRKSPASTACRTGGTRKHKLQQGSDGKSFKSKLYQ